MPGPRMRINVYNSSGTGHVNFTFDDGQGQQFTVGATSRGSLAPVQPGNPAFLPGGIGANFTGTLDGVLRYEFDTLNPATDFQSEWIELDQGAFNGFVQFLNANLGTDRTPRPNVGYFLDYDLAVAGLRPVTSGVNYWLFALHPLTSGFIATWELEGRNGLNCTEWIFGGQGIPALVSPNFDYGRYVPANELGRSAVGAYVLQNHSPSYSFNPANIQLPSIIVHNGTAYQVQMPWGWEGDLARIFQDAIRQRGQSGGPLDYIFIQQIYAQLNALLVAPPEGAVQYTSGGGSPPTAHVITSEKVTHTFQEKVTHTFQKMPSCTAEQTMYSAQIGGLPHAARCAHCCAEHAASCHAARQPPSADVLPRWRLRSLPAAGGRVV